MFIGLCGGICSGKSTIANYLVKEHGFRLVTLARSTPTPAIEKSADEASTIPSESGSTSALADGEFHFGHVDELLDFVTKRWQERWVTTHVWDESILEALQHRPFFILVSVDAPVVLRWKRFVSRCETYNMPAPSLADFVARNDAQLYSPPTSLAHLLHQAQLRLLNSSDSLDALQASLKALNLTDESRLRPSWDQYFMKLASLAAHRSNCMKRSVGCVLVREKRVVSTGYNGTPRGMRNCNEGGCKYIRPIYGVRFYADFALAPAVTAG